MRVRWLGVVLGLALVAAACGNDDDGSAATDESPDDAEAEPADGDPIIIGAAIDQSNQMAPFDVPAFTAAQIAADEINEAGGVLGRPLELRAIDTQLDPDRTASAALDLIDQGAEVMLVTCDFDWSAPAAQESLAVGILTIAPCVGDPIFGPPGFGEIGELAFSMGNASFAEGSALAEFAMEQGWERAATVSDNAIVYFQNVCRGFTNRFEELGGEIVVAEDFVQGDGTIPQVVSSLEGANIDAIAACSFPPDMPSMFAQLRAAGVDAPLLSPWSGDGNFWIDAVPNLSDYYFVTFVSVFGDDPEPEVQELIAAYEERAGEPPATGGFVTGASAIEAVAAAIEETGTTDGQALADAFLEFDGFETVSGPLSFTEDVHIQTDRPFRLIEVQNGEYSVRDIRAAEKVDLPE
jgi:branched-chain amino acid transport system substrate-binding protein